VHEIMVIHLINNQRSDQCFDSPKDKVHNIFVILLRRGLKACSGDRTMPRLGFPRKDIVLQVVRITV